jgi:hypothetical protein
MEELKVNSFSEETQAKILLKTLRLHQAPSHLLEDKIEEESLNKLPQIIC